ncbi:DUF1318 domain-containing protein [Candidatus Vondammii sp. HM_W22]|uniref:DUF1318 domain-containing protein n=1 Tax=Candidatus Vondammii sp. HM_W22 TaxID=2687299 RepID=UPI001F13F722|nr:DUF1318 domain-containing protein [Candidatus Vondammii sp. HM_W22]
MKAFKTPVLLAACVTINIYFPSAQAEEAAERIVDDILGTQKQDKNPIDEDKGARLEPAVEASFASQLLELIIPSAQAAQPNFNINTPGIRKLQASMKKRNNSLKRYYATGGIGFTKNALVSIHDASVISLKERNKAKKLVSAENKDRNALYKAIAKANGHPEWEADVRTTFARTWVQKASAGWWYQTSKGKWKKR